MYRLLSIILLTLTLCACSLAPPARPSLPENTLRASSPPPSPSLSPSPSPAPTLSPTPSPSPSPKYVPTYPTPPHDVSMYSIKPIVQFEHEGITVIQYYYYLEIDGYRYEGIEISASPNAQDRYLWRLDYCDYYIGQYDAFYAIVHDRDRFYLFSRSMVSAYDVAMGNEIWSLKLNGSPFKGVVDSNGNLYVSCLESPLIVAISPEGEILWQHYDVEEYRGAWSMEIIDDEIMILTEDDYGKYHIFFDFDGNYRVEKVESPEFLNPATVDGPN